VNVWYDVAKNGLIWSNISGSTGPIFAIFTPYESALCADDGSVAYFLICQGTLPLQPNNVAIMYQRRLIPLAFGALVPETNCNIMVYLCALTAHMMHVYRVKIS